MTRNEPNHDDRTTPAGLEATANALVEARMTNAVLARYPGAMPSDLAAGYAIQEHAIGIAGQSIGGWKVGRVPADQIGELGIDRLAGPIMADRIFTASGDEPVMPLLDGFAAAEGEILVRMATIPEQWDSVDDLAHHAAEIRLGIEIASSPFQGINAHGAAVTVSDFGNNHGLVLGPIIDGWTAIDWRHRQMTLTIDDVLAGEATLAAMLDGPFGAVAFLIEHLRARGRQLGPDDWISTGAVTGVHPVAAGSRVEVTFGDLTVTCRTSASASVGRTVA